MKNKTLIGKLDQLINLNIENIFYLCKFRTMGCLERVDRILEFNISNIKNSKEVIKCINKQSIY